jgi:8-oxo-dGTP pyrophosphatase MutT (NUDIX family)
MTHRKNLIHLLNNYNPDNKSEQQAKNIIESFVEKNTNCFERENLNGHITASCWLVCPNKARVLLTHHKKLDLWLQLGGHCDGDSEVLNVALNEAREESGISNIMPLSNKIFDIDVHPIPTYKKTPQHIHYDIRFLIQATSTNYTVSNESNDLKWCEINPENFSGGLKRMAEIFCKKYI